MHLQLELHSGGAPDGLFAATRDDSNDERHRAEHRRRVLVVDDDIDTARSLSLLFDVWGCRVEYAINGIVALSIAQRLIPDIIIVDLKLPDTHGSQLTRQLRAHPSLRNARIVAITGSSQADDRERALAAGCDDVLLKPVPINALEQLLA